MGEVNLQDPVGDVTGSPLGGGELEGARTMDSEGDISLHAASKEGNLAVVQLLLDGGAEVNKRDQSYETPLDLASGEGIFEVANLLIEHGANVNSRDKFGSTLHKASEFGHLDVVRLLLDHGADANAAKQDQWTT